MAKRSVVSSKLFVASAAAGLLTLAAAANPAQAAEAKDDKVHCYGINKCKGTGDCGGKGHSCAGQNSCKGKGWLELDKETCLKIQGGRLTAQEKKG
jgi:uncharacterized membrane protein